MNKELKDDGKFYGFTEDKMFGWVMENTEICEHILRIILPEKDIRLIENRSPEKQKTEDTSDDSKDIRLDILARGSDGTIYDIDMQTTNNRNLGRRMRYYQSHLDQRTLQKSNDYKDLLNTIIIFICDFDGNNYDGVNNFKEDRVRYVFTARDTEDESITLNTGSEMVFINGKGRLGKKENRELEKLLRLMKNQPVDDPIIKKAEKIIAENNTDPKRRAEIMLYESKIREYQDAAREKGIEEGIQKGMQQGRAEGMQQGRAEGMRQGRAEGMQQGVQKGTAEERARAIPALVKSLQAQHLDNDTIISVLTSSYDISKAEAIKLINK